MAKPYRRSSYFTKKGFQSRFTLRFIAASVLANMLTITLFIILARNRMDGLLYAMRLPPGSAGALLAPAAFTASITAVIGVSILFLWASRRLHYAIAGPLQQIRTGLHQIGKGDLSCRVTLRESDEFKDFAGDINAMVEELNGRFTVLKDHADKLASTAKTLRTSPTAEESLAIRQSMLQTARSLKEQVKTFSL
jgi:methyl-accepting chemotaxis protein